MLNILIISNSGDRFGAFGKGALVFRLDGVKYEMPAYHVPSLYLNIISFGDFMKRQPSGHTRVYIEDYMCLRPHVIARASHDIYQFQYAPVLPEPIDDLVLSTAATTSFIKDIKLIHNYKPYPKLKKCSTALDTFDTVGSGSLVFYLDEDRFGVPVAYAPGIRSNLVCVGDFMRRQPTRFSSLHVDHYEMRLGDHLIAKIFNGLYLSELTPICAS